MALSFTQLNWWLSYDAGKKWEQTGKNTQRSTSLYLTGLYKHCEFISHHIYLFISHHIDQESIAKGRWQE